MNWRAQYCAPPLASIPTTQRGSLHGFEYLRTPQRFGALPIARCFTAPHTANTYFAKSIPIVVTSTDLPALLGCSAHIPLIARPYKRAGVHTISLRVCPFH